MPEAAINDGNADIHRTQSLANEAIQAVRSHEKFNELQFKVVDSRFASTDQKFVDLAEDMDNKHQELKNMITTYCNEMREGFKANDAKFWALAVALITILFGICGFLIVYTLFPGHR